MGILIGKTVAQFGYRPDALSKASTSPVVIKCDFCKKEKISNKGLLSARGNIELVTCGKIKCSVEKRKRTNINVFGVEHSTQSKKVLNKRKRNTLKNYGVEHTTQLSLTKRRSRKTCKDNYGVSNPSKSKVVKLRKEKTTLKNHGVKYYAQTDEAKIRARKVNIANGSWYKTLTRSDIKKAKNVLDYRNQIISITNYYITTSMKNKRSREIHIDHIYSCYDGFINNVHPKIIGHRCNLRLMNGSDNCSKHNRSDQTLEQLKSKIRKYEGLKRLCKFNFYSKELKWKR